MRAGLDEIEYSCGRAFLEEHDDGRTFGMSWSSDERMEGLWMWGNGLSRAYWRFYTSLSNKRRLCQRDGGVPRFGIFVRLVSCGCCSI